MSTSPDAQSGQPSLHEAWLAQASHLAVSGSHLANMEGFLSDMEEHHRATYEHSMRVGLLAPQIGAIVPELEDLSPKALFYAGTMHDWGKLKTPQELLDKTSVWTQEDAEALRAHPVDSYEALIKEGMALTAGVVIRHHRFQPNPYPEALPEADPHLPEHLVRLQPILGRVIALADFYDASHRKNSAGNMTAEQIKAKVYQANPDINDLIDRLYAERIFS